MSIISGCSFLWPCGNMTVILFITLLFCVFAQSQNQNFESQSHNTTDSSAAQQAKEPLDKGLEFLYVLANGYLDIVKPSGVSREDLRELGIDVNSFDVNVATLEGSWQKIIKLFPGYTACVIIGLLYFLILPIAGFIFCCCRCCCKKCGARPSFQEGKNDKCLRGCGGVTLAIIVTIVLAAVVCAFLTNEIVSHRTNVRPTNKETNILSTARQSLRDIRTFKDTTLSELQNELVDGFATAEKNILATLRASPERAEEAIGRVTDATRILTAAENLAQSLKDIQVHLKDVNSSVSILREKQHLLVDELTAIKTNIVTAVGQCFIDQCLDITYRAGNLTIVANFSQVDDITSQLTKIDDVIGQNITALIKRGKKDFEAISNRVHNATGNEISDVEAEMAKVKKEVMKSYEDVKRKIDQMLNINITTTLDEAVPQISKYGDYRWYAGLVIGCILLLIVLLYYMGLCFGCGGEAGYEDSRTCNRSMGSHMLMAGVFCTVSLCWIIMLVAVLLFLVGGLTHTEACRQLVADPADSELIQLVQLAMENSSVRINISETIRSCQNDKSLYQAAEVEKIYNLTGVLSLDNYDLRQKMEEIKNIDVNISDIDLLDDKTRTELENVENAGLEQIDFDSFTQELEKQLTNENLTLLSEDINRLATDIEVAFPLVAEYLRSNATRLERADKLFAQPMLLETGILKGTVLKLKELLQRTSGEKNFQNYTRDLINEFDLSSRSVKVNGTKAVKQFVSDIADEVYGNLERDVSSTLNHVKFSIGKCRPLYDVLENTINVACVDLLYPFNGFWFSVATCLGLFLPCIFIACCLSSLYRKSEAYNSEAKTFDDPRYSWMREQQTSLLEHQYPY